ncbi:YiiD C-terminal domain-containing protein [uncultured Marinobacter sp.]|uniref:YiiD C-terminal domain-containing protein n=1 Tax=uncultured Marinobacter sp. TaxID=187379 RepID=UPI0030DAA7F7
MATSPRLAAFEQRIHDVIPLTGAMAIELCDYDGQALLVSAPLAPNSNHQGTGFGGSVYSIAVVAAWGLVELMTEDNGIAGHVVVQQGAMDYLKPAEDGLFALCRLPEEAEVARFLKTVRRSGRGRLALTARVYCGTPDLAPAQEPVAVFEGRFVVQLKPTGKAEA